MAVATAAELTLVCGERRPQAISEEKRTTIDSAIWRRQLTQQTIDPDLDAHSELPGKTVRHPLRVTLAERIDDQTGGNLLVQSAPRLLGSRGVSGIGALPESDAGDARLVGERTEHS